jgi:nucleotide-binding universal stress UspA family protein
MKAVLAATTLEEAQPAVEWCQHHLDPGDVVTVVYGVSGLGEFALGLPPFDALGGERQLKEQFEKTYCQPLTRAGIRAELRVEVESTSRAIVDVAKAVGADMIVITKHRHHAATDAILGDPAVHLAHDPPCPLVIIPSPRVRARHTSPGTADAVSA